MTSFQVDQQNTYGITRARRADHVIEFYFGIKDEWWMPFETILITVTEPRQNGLHKT